MIESALLERARAYRPYTVTVTQTYSAFGKYKSYPAFQDWINRLHKGDRLPRGRFFAKKKPGRPLSMLDEFHLSR